MVNSDGNSDCYFRFSLRNAGLFNWWLTGFFFNVTVFTKWDLENIINICLKLVFPNCKLYWMQTFHRKLWRKSIINQLFIFSVKPWRDSCQASASIYLQTSCLIICLHIPSLVRSFYSTKSVTCPVTLWHWPSLSRISAKLWKSWLNFCMRFGF